MCAKGVDQEAAQFITSVYLHAIKAGGQENVMTHPGVLTADNKAVAIELTCWLVRNVPTYGGQA